MDFKPDPTVRHDPNFQVYFHFLQKSTPVAASSARASSSSSSSSSHRLDHPTAYSSSKIHPASNQYHNHIHHQHAKSPQQQSQQQHPPRSMTFPLSSHVSSMQARNEYQTRESYQGVTSGLRQNSIPLPPIHSLLAMDDPLVGPALGWGPGRTESGELRWYR